VPLERLPEYNAARGGVGAGYRELLKPRLRRNTLLLWVAFTELGAPNSMSVNQAKPRSSGERRQAR
jgi:hypothetical protein